MGATTQIGRLPAPAAPAPRAVEPTGAAEPLDVVALLKAYRAALKLARRPPASLKLHPGLERLHCWLRPTFGCHYFATRIVRRRTVALERALTACTAVRGADGGKGKDELEALRSFRASLTPPPPRGWTVAGFIAAILLSQTLVGQLLGLMDASSWDEPSPIQAMFDNLSLAPDVRSIGDLVRTLASANFVEFGVIIASAAGVIYVFGRPLASGYRLAQLCLDGPVRRGRRRACSPLCRRAGQLRSPRPRGGDRASYRCRISP